MQTEKAKKTKKKRLSGDERKSQIVRVAADLFAKRGFRGTTTREIARRAGISEAVIYRHFSKKEDLYRAIINDRCDDNTGQSRLMRSLEGKRAEEVFREVARFMLEEHRDDPTFLRLLTFSALDQSDLSEIFIKTRAMVLLNFIEGHIKELIKEGALRKIDPKLSARAFLGMVFHYIMSQEIFGYKKYFRHRDEEVIESFVKIFLDGIRRR